MKSVNNKTRATLLAVALGCGLVSTTRAGDKLLERQNTVPPAASAQLTLIERATSLIGLPVKDKAGEEIGRVHEIVLAPDHKKIAYLAFLPFGSSMADGKFARAPIEKTTLSADRTFFTYDMPRDVVAKDAAALDPALPWSQKVTALLQLPVIDADKQRAGTVRNLLIDLPNHSVARATIGTGGMMGFREKLASVDWSMVSVQEADRVAGIGMTSEQLRSIAYKADAYWEQLGFAGEEKKAPEERKLDKKAEPEPIDGNKLLEVPKENEPLTPIPPIKY